MARVNYRKSIMIILMFLASLPSTTSEIRCTPSLTEVGMYKNQSKKSNPICTANILHLPLEVFVAFFSFLKMSTESDKNPQKMKKIIDF